MGGPGGRPPWTKHRGFFYLNTKLLAPFCMKIDEKLLASGGFVPLTPPGDPAGDSAPRPPLGRPLAMVPPFGKSWIRPCSLFRVYFVLLRSASSMVRSSVIGACALVLERYSQLDIMMMCRFYLAQVTA